MPGRRRAPHLPGGGCDNRWVIRRHTLPDADNRRLAHLCGPLDENLRRIEEALGVSLARRDASFRIQGPAPAVDRAAALIDALYDKAQAPIGAQRLSLMLVDAGAPGAPDMVNASRDQSQLAPSRFNCPMMVPLDLIFCCQTRSRNFSRPISRRVGSRFSAISRSVHLRRDAGMIGARLPEHVISLHALPADQDVLQRVVQHVPERQHPGHVRRGNDNGKTRLG